MANEKNNSPSTLPCSRYEILAASGWASAPVYFTGKNAPCYIFATVPGTLILLRNDDTEVTFPAAFFSAGQAVIGGAFKGIKNGSTADGVVVGWN